jgi:hypothetical protein
MQMVAMVSSLIGPRYYWAPQQLYLQICRKMFVGLSLSSILFAAAFSPLVRSTTCRLPLLHPKSLVPNHVAPGGIAPPKTNTPCAR